MSVKESILPSSTVEDTCTVYVQGAGSSVEDTCTVYVQGAGSTVEDTCTVYVQEEIIKRERTDDQGKIYSLITSAQNQNTQNIIYQFRGHISFSNSAFSLYP